MNACYQVKDGFFVHHYAPTALSVLQKHVVFVLDLSSSMAGRRITQLKLAMAAILDELRTDDYFSIVQFNSFKSVRTIHTTLIIVARLIILNDIGLEPIWQRKEDER